MATSSESQSKDVAVDVDLATKFAAFCDAKTKDQFTPKACNKLVKDHFEKDYKFKSVILTNIVDSSVFSKCKEKSKPHMSLNSANCEKFLRLTAHEFAKLKHESPKMSADDQRITDIYDDLVQKVLKSEGKKIKQVKQSATGNVAGLTDTKNYTGAHKQRFDETGKGRGKAGRVDEFKNTGYVDNYKGEGTFDKEAKK